MLDYEGAGRKIMVAVQAREIFSCIYHLHLWTHAYMYNTTHHTFLPPFSHTAKGRVPHIFNLYNSNPNKQ